MRTNIDIDQDLLDRVMKATGAKTKKDAVHQALRELLNSIERERLSDHEGRVAFLPDYDYKSSRSDRT